MTGRTRRLLAHLLAVSLAAAMAVVVPTAAATAAPPAAPSGLTPDGGPPVSGIPVLSWDRVEGATKYRVEVSANADRSAPFFTAETLNPNIVPTTPVPVGTLYWRVRAINAETGDWAPATFERDPVAPPLNRAPAGGAELQAPEQVPTLVWSAVPSAESYDVQVSDDPEFSTDRIVASATGRRNTSFTLPRLQSPGDYYWRVSAQLGSGRVTTWSDPTSYRVLGLSAPALVSPADDPAGATPVTEVVLDWAPVDGAVTYELQVDTDENFTTPDHARAGIVGTRYSPPAGLANDQYYWRVRPYDADANKPEWSEVATWQFRRSWPDQPHLEHPLDGAEAGDPFFYQWSAVPWASSYRLQVDDNPQLSSPVTCTTVHTTFTPSYSPCMPQPGQRVYWRVVATDADTDVPTVAIAAEVSSFTYDVQRPVLTTPADGATVQVPTLRWQPVRGAKSYRVTVSNAAGAVRANEVTHATSFTPRGRLAPGAHRWDVRPIFDDGREGTSVVPSSQRRFTVADLTSPTSPTPEPTGTQGQSGNRFPTLTWARVADRNNKPTEYRVLVRRSDETVYRYLGGVPFQYPAGEELGTGFMAPGTYEWMVEAYPDDGEVVRSTGSGTFVIQSPTLTTGYAGSLTGTALYGAAGDEPDTCDLVAPEGCTNLRQTPVLSWDHVPEADHYELIYSRDSELTNIVRTVRVNDTRYIPADALPDSQAGSAYYVFVRPCNAGFCGPVQAATRAFSKLGVGVDLRSPANGAVVGDDVVLDWGSLLEAEQTAAAAEDTDVQDTPARTEALKYVVQISARSDFTSTTSFRVIEEIVEQTTYTAYGRTFPDGPIYWRVRAADGTGNLLPWSAVGSFIHASPVPAPVAPAEGAVLRGEQRYQWEPLDFARSYDLEVYDRVPAAGSTAGRVLSVNTTQTSYAPADRVPVSSAPYYWRVRRVDASGFRSDWGPLRSFYSAGDAPTLESPAAGATVSPTEVVFSWAPTQTAARSYQWQYRVAGSTDVKTTVETRALDYANTFGFAAGDFEWRVVGLDTAGRPIGASAWRTFSVVDPPTATTPVRIEGSAQVGKLLLVQAPTWNVGGVRTTYQWFRGRDALPGETGTSYRVTEADLGKSITVRATGTKPGYKPGLSVSEAVVGGAVPPVEPLEPTQEASISGTARVGGRLTVDPGTWPGDPDFAYQWYRSGRPIPGATRTTYDVVADDAGRDLAVLVTADDPDDELGEGTSVAGPERVARLTSATRLVTAQRIRAAKRPVATVVVRVPGVASPAGRVTVLDGRRSLASRALGAQARGSVRITLPRLARGRHVLRATFAGGTQASGSTSAPVTVTVVR